jgi:ABC-type transport system involved in multi-copper enzyme maturation permease subunit
MATGNTAAGVASMLGPLFYLEMLLGARRGRQHFFRWCYAGWLLLLVFCWLIGYYGTANQNPDANVTSEWAGGFVRFFLSQQYILILLATPVFVAGGVTDEKTRGTMIYLLTTDLTAWQILVGKLLGRLAQVGTLVLTGLPVLMAVGVFGGLSPPALAAVLVSTLAPLPAFGAASLLSAVWSRTTRDAVIGFFAAALVGLVLYNLAGWALTAAPTGSRLFDGLRTALAGFDPLYVLGSGGSTAGDWEELARRGLVSLASWGTLAAVCLLVAGWRLRSAYIRQLESSGRTGMLDRVLPARPPVYEDNPVLWMVQHVEGIAPLPILRRFPRWLAVAIIFLGTASLDLYFLWDALVPSLSFQQVQDAWSARGFTGLFGLADGREIAPQVAAAFLFQGLVAILIATFVVGVRCSGCVSGDREKQTWDNLLLVPLETRSLTGGKAWGVLRASLPYLAAYALPTLALSAVSGISSLVLSSVALASTALAMVFVAAAGLYCSVRSPSSWRALLGTFGISYVGGFLVFALLSPGFLIATVFLMLFFLVLLQAAGLPPNAVPLGQFPFVFFITCCIGLAVLFGLTAWYFLAHSESYVGQVERTRHWTRRPRLRSRRVVRVVSED